MDILSYNEISRMYRHFVQLNGTSEPLDVLLNNPGGFNSWLVQEGKMSLFEQLISSPNGAASVAASSTAMNAVAASSTAMNAVAASSTAMNAVIASSTAMNAVAASSTAMNAVIASSTAMNAVIASSTAMNAVAASSTAMNTVAASSTAMNAVIASSTARPIVWASSTALNAIQSAPSAVLDALQSHPRTSMMNGYPSALASTFISGKSMVFRVRNTTGSDTNYLQALAGGSGSGNDSFSTTTTWQTRVRAYSDIMHYNYANNYLFQAYIINMNP